MARSGAVTRSLRDSLARLGVDHVDLIQCHDVEIPLAEVEAAWHRRGGGGLRIVLRP